MRRPPILARTAATTVAATATAVCAAAALAPVAGAHAAHPTHAVTRTVSAHLRLGRTFEVSHRLLTVPGRRILIQGETGRWAPGQHLTVQAHLGRRRVLVRRLAIRRARHGHGRFALAVSAPGAGRLRLQVDHRATGRLGHLQASRELTIVPERASDPLFAALVQQRLAAAHIYMPRSSGWGLQTELGIDAYRRLIGRAPGMTLDGATLSALLDGRGAFAVRDPAHGLHVEGDLGTQLLALVDGSHVLAIYPMSSGKPSTPTILGDYRIYRRVPGYLPDGMYYSDFFIRGYAVHGYDPAPDYPASHGCMRLPISDAISIFDRLALGDWVDVYR